MTKIKNWIRKFLASPKTRAVALMLLVGGTAAFAQSGAGDYTAGTSALTTVAEEIAKYVPIVVKLCYAIAGVVAIVGAISVTCSGGATLSKGSTQYKCGTCGKTLSSHTKECAMRSSVIEGNVDTSELQSMLAQARASSSTGKAMCVSMKASN